MLSQRESDNNIQNNQSQSKILDAPTFQLPDGFDSDRYELWSVRVPTGFDMNKLQGQFDFNLSSNDNNKNDNSNGGGDVGKNDGNRVVMQFEGNNGKMHGLCSGQEMESQAYRLLLRSSTKRKKDKNDSSDDEVGEEENSDSTHHVLKPYGKGFDRHLNVMEIPPSFVNEKFEMELAPAPERAPTIDDSTKAKMRIPYCQIDQKSGLKRRWKPFGSVGLVMSHTGASSGKDELDNVGRLLETVEAKDDSGHDLHSENEDLPLSKKSNDKEKVQNTSFDKKKRKTSKSKDKDKVSSTSSNKKKRKTVRGC
mmetsp:Transcript_14921/g.21350  ORF Transcript_14921/g.21350 Transcript_14921/m.21350 type:complete len:309 (+) Transcript_14921:109-1035(+)